jgi:purine-binding chemotaxis protein CheW
VTDSLPPASIDESDATAPESRAEGDTTDAIVVRMGGGRFAIELAFVAEVGRTPTVTRVPGLPAWLAGVANWRGRILPVLDLRPLLGAEACEFDSAARLVVLTDVGVAVGMVVDAVEGTTPMSGVAAFPSLSSVGGFALLSGQVPREDGPLAVLDVPAVLRLREGLPRGRRSA